MRDGKGREVDVALRHPDNVEFYVEVKDVDAGFLFWSALEVDKAKSAPDRYIMAIARPASGGGFETLWLPRPLDVLRDSVTSGRWVWNYEETVEDVEPWDIPQRDEREGRFSFVIDVQWDELAGRDETLDEDGLVDLLETFRLSVSGAT